MGNKRGVSEVRKEKYFKFAKELYKITKSPNKISPTDLKETCKIYEIGNIAPSVLKTCGYIKKTNGFYQWSGASPTKERMNVVMELLGKRERLSKLKYSLKNNLNINNFTKEEHKELELEGVIMDNNITKTYSKEKILFNILKDIYESCEDLIRKEEENIRFKFNDNIDFKSSIKSLKKYIEKSDEDFNLKLL